MMDAADIHYYKKLEAENKELRLYLKTFLRATIDPEDRDMGVHEANPTMDWSFTLVEDGDPKGRVITGGQIRRAAEIIGFDKLGIDPCTRTISDDLRETAELRRQRQALRATIQGMIIAVKGRGLPPRHLGESDLTSNEVRQYAEILHMEFSEYTGKINANKRADFLDEAVEMGTNILEQTKKV